ncbi:MAG: SpoIIE family protein phosphatase, partial [Clostridia bacterium]|nr:SpoIIE family protein phosphatase [Clostridia bacterium]
MITRTNFFKSNFIVYLLLAFAFPFLACVGENCEPIGLALLFACLSADLSVAVCGGLYLLSPVLCGNFSLSILLPYVGQAALLAVPFLFKRRLIDWKRNIIAFSLAVIGLAAFVAFSPFEVYPLPFSAAFFQQPLTQKIVVAALIFLLCAAFSVAVKALFIKVLRCRLKADEILFALLLYLLAGVGACRFFGVNAYMGIAFFILLAYAYVAKDASAAVCAFVLSLPLAFFQQTATNAFFLYGVVAALCARYGKLTEVFALLLAFFCYAWKDGAYAFPTSQLIPALLSALIPCLCFLLTPNALLHKLEYELVFYREKHLSRIAINRNRAAIGEQLFEISAVFREIQTTFHALATTDPENGAKEYVRNCVTDRVCKKCPNYAACVKSDVEDSLNKLIDVGCLKGKVNLMDVPSSMAKKCVDQNGILNAVNRQLGDFRKLMIEAENAASGRTLLANQAQGVSEILKNIAMEQSEPLRIHQDKERALNVALLRVGIVCSEILVYSNENDVTLSLITFGAANVKKIAEIATQTLGKEMIISKRLALSKDKYCCILRKKPRFDAAFGIASMMKYGETASGDAHSVIRIDERRFMVALSDGMGSGEYAKRISESTVSLLESFYRAKMPSSLILSTVNKLLSFNREESFACVDIAVIDLDSGDADVVKIGSPFGFILSGNAMKILESASMPLGILDALHPETAAYSLQANDVLLFLSDGITAAFGSSADLYETVKNI